MFNISVTSLVLITASVLMAISAIVTFVIAVCQKNNRETDLAELKIIDEVVLMSTEEIITKDSQTITINK